MTRRYDSTAHIDGQTAPRAGSPAVVFLALIAERMGWWELDGLLRDVREKMVRRHPHVFGAQRARSARAAFGRWSAADRLQACLRRQALSERSRRPNARRGRATTQS